jgi:hypothetical protein
MFLNIAAQLYFTYMKLNVIPNKVCVRMFTVNIYFSAHGVTHHLTFGCRMELIGVHSIESIDSIHSTGLACMLNVHGVTHHLTFGCRMELIGVHSIESIHSIHSIHSTGLACMLNVHGVSPGLEITFPTFPITAIGNHDFLPIK